MISIAINMRSKRLHARENLVTKVIGINAGQEKNRLIIFWKRLLVISLQAY